MRGPFELTGDCAYDFEFDLPVGGLPFDAIPDLTVPTMVAHMPEIIAPDMDVPDLCHCFTFDIDRTMSIGGKYWPGLKLGITPKSDDCCDREYSVNIGVDIPCLPFAISVVDLNMVVGGKTVDGLNMDIRRDGAECEYDVNLNLDIPCMPYSIAASSDIKISDNIFRFNFNVSRPPPTDYDVLTRRTSFTVEVVDVLTFDLVQEIATYNTAQYINTEWIPVYFTSPEHDGWTFSLAPVEFTCDEMIPAYTGVSVDVVTHKSIQRTCIDFSIVQENTAPCEFILGLDLTLPCLPLAFSSTGTIHLIAPETPYIDINVVRSVGDVVVGEFGTLSEEACKFNLSIDIGIPESLGGGNPFSCGDLDGCDLFSCGDFSFDTGTITAHLGDARSGPALSVDVNEVAPCHWQLGMDLKIPANETLPFHVSIPDGNKWKLQIQGGHWIRAAGTKHYPVTTEPDIFGQKVSLSTQTLTVSLIERWSWLNWDPAESDWAYLLVYLRREEPYGYQRELVPEKLSFALAPHLDLIEALGDSLVLWRPIAFVKLATNQSGDPVMVYQIVQLHEGDIVDAMESPDGNSQLQTSVKEAKGVKSLSYVEDLGYRQGLLQDYDAHHVLYHETDIMDFGSDTAISYFEDGASAGHDGEFAGHIEKKYARFDSSNYAAWYDKYPETANNSASLEVYGKVVQLYNFQQEAPRDGIDFSTAYEGEYSVLVRHWDTETSSLVLQYLEASTLKVADAAHADVADVADEARTISELPCANIDWSAECLESLADDLEEYFDYWVTGDQDGSTTIGLYIRAPESKSPDDAFIDLEHCTLSVSGGTGILIGDLVNAPVDGVTVDWRYGYLYSGYDSVTGTFDVSVDWMGRELVDVDGVVAVNWDDRSLMTTFGGLACYWEDGRLYDPANTGDSIRWMGRELVDVDGVVAVNWDDRSLLATTGIACYWEDGWLYDPVNYMESIKWMDRQLVNEAGVTVLDWSTTVSTLGIQSVKVGSTAMTPGAGDLSVADQVRIGSGADYMFIDNDRIDVTGGITNLDIQDSGGSTTFGGTVEIVDDLTVGSPATAYLVSAGGIDAYSLVNSDNGFRTETVTRAAFGNGDLSLVTGGTNLGIGTYYYYISYYTAIGETDVASSRGSITTDASNRKVSVAVPVSPDYRVLGRRIYRTVVGDIHTPKLLVDIGDNTTAVYVDDIADGSLTGEGMYFRNNNTSVFLKDGDVTVFLPGINAYRSGYQAGNDAATGGRNAFAGSSVMGGVYNNTGTDSAGFGYGVGYKGVFTRSVAIGTYNCGAIDGAVTDCVSIGFQAMFGAYGVTRTPRHSIAIGTGALAYGDYAQCVGIGYYAGANNNGNNNVFVGGYAGRGPTAPCTGRSNVGVGYQALFGLTTGIANVAIGQEALKDVSTTNYSTGVGYQAGRYQTGTSNVFVGRNCGVGTSGLSSTSYNVAVGYSAGSKIQGNNCCFVGGLAGAETTGAYSAFFGNNAGRYMTTGNYNCSFGNEALQGNSTTKATGNTNTVIGAYGLRYATTASNNTTLGYFAGGAITTGNNNLCIGARAGKYSTTEGSEFFLNNLDQGDRASDITDSLMYGIMATNDPANQYLAINAETDIFGDLTVNGDVIIEACNLITDTTTGLKIGTATDQKLGFFNATPVVQPATIIDADGTLADITTKYNNLLAKLEALGILAT